MDQPTARVALVTGAASGVGRATALHLADQGYAVACLDIDGERAEATAAQVAALGRPSLGRPTDVAAPDSVAAAVNATVADLGGLDVVVNAAGVASTARTEHLALSEWQRLLAVNLTGTFLVCQSALGPLLDRGGAIVNVSSVAGLNGWRYMAGYAASKGGIVALTKSLAAELAGRGVRVNAVAPGSIDTPLAHGLSPPADADAELLRRGGALVDPPRSQPEEIAAAIAYLASPAARFVTGTVLVIDGGALL